MSHPVIRVENLSKKYVIGHQKADRRTTLRDVLSDGAKSAFRAVNPFNRTPKLRTDDLQEEFWALKDVSFEVKQGDRVGIIGRNGAGKSTLLKILSRITEPTTGQIRIRGRVASLLEVGTGFHPELTGRENIFLNGAVLGMSKAEIRRKFDEIVAFAEVEKFLDTPVKRYSSGMYVRLAFAVAAHLEPEILIVDEVLAVGDAQFQKKCLGKMEEVAEEEGRTVLFVSHNMAAVEKLCQRGVFLHQGKVQYFGNHLEAINCYLANSSENLISLQERLDRQGSGELRVTGIEFRDTQGNPLSAVRSGQSLDVHFYFETNPKVVLSRIIVGFLVRTQLDAPVFLQHNLLTQDDFGVLPEKGTFICRIAKLPLPSSKYTVTYSVLSNYGIDGIYIDSLQNAVELTVIDGDFYGSGQIPPISHGVCLVEASWRMEASVQLLT